MSVARLGGTKRPTHPHVGGPALGGRFATFPGPGVTPPGFAFGKVAPE